MAGLTDQPLDWSSPLDIHQVLKLQDTPGKVREGSDPGKVREAGSRDVQTAYMPRKSLMPRTLGINTRLEQEQARAAGWLSRLSA